MWKRVEIGVIYEGFEEPQRQAFKFLFDFWSECGSNMSDLEWNNNWTVM
jgi:hypothetical protein